MILEDKIKITFITGSLVGRWNLKYSTNYKIGDEIEVDFRLLLTTKLYRRKLLKCKCDRCGKIFYSRLDILAKKSECVCKSCNVSGDRNPRLHKPVSEITRQRLSDAVKGEKNGFYGKKHTLETLIKIGQKSKGNKHHLGKKNTPEQIKHISDGVNRGYRDGTRAKTHGNSLKGNYKGILYLSSYELAFLKHIEDTYDLAIVERGPTIQYISTVDNKQHSYLSDFYVGYLNLVIEIKSEHFWKLDEEINVCKRNATMLQFNYLLILENDFTELDKLLKCKSK